MMPDLSKLSFYSLVNYLKRDSNLENTTLLTLPASGSSVSYPINHNFGYVPQVYVGVDADNDGIIWSNQKVHAYTDTSASGLAASDVQQVLSSYTVDENQLVIYLENQTTTAAGQQRRIYWTIYKDYGN